MWAGSKAPGGNKQRLYIAYLQAVLLQSNKIQLARHCDTKKSTASCLHGFSL